MSLETATYIQDLVATNPVSGDDVAQGDDHIRLIKAVLKTTFPGATGALTFPTLAVTAKSAAYAITSAERTATFLATTTGGAFAFTLPSLVAGDAGWECSFIKVNSGVNPFFITPPSGTIQSGEVSGLARTRRCIPGRRTRVLWTGSAWIAERVVSEPIGTILDFTMAALPDGYEFAYGQTLTSASTNYPDYYLANGSSGVVRDHRGYVAAGKDDMGGSSANRLTTPLNGDTLGAVGGAEGVTLDTTMIPSHLHLQTAQQPTFGYNTGNDFAGTGGDTAVMSVNPSGGTAVTTTGDTTPGNTGNTGGGLSHANVQPTIVLNKLVVVE